MYSHDLIEGIIAAGDEKFGISRLELQKLVYILQELGLETEYDDYTLYQYGPYSAGLQSDIGLCIHRGTIVEECYTSSHTYRLKPTSVSTYGSEEYRYILRQYGKAIRVICDCTDILELAATYAYYIKDCGLSIEDAKKALKIKKASLYNKDNFLRAESLFISIGLKLLEPIPTENKVAFTQIKNGLPPLKESVLIKRGDKYEVGFLDSGKIVSDLERYWYKGTTDDMLKDAPSVYFWGKTKHSTVFSTSESPVRLSDEWLLLPESTTGIVNEEKTIPEQASRKCRVEAMIYTAYDSIILTYAYTDKDNKVILREPSILW